MPNGIGFCMLITDACRAKTGLLNDVEFYGWLWRRGRVLLKSISRRIPPHIARSTLFVAHEGERSFGDRKRSLVVRNIQRLEHMFPAIRAENLRVCEGPAFASGFCIASDALLSAPVAEKTASRSSHPCERWTKGASGQAIGSELQLAHNGHCSICLSSREFLVPADFSFDLSHADDWSAVASRLRRFSISTVVLEGIAHPPWVFGLAEHLGCKVLVTPEHDVATPLDVSKLVALGATIIAPSDSQAMEWKQCDSRLDVEHLTLNLPTVPTLRAVPAAKQRAIAVVADYGSSKLYAGSGSSFEASARRRELIDLVVLDEDAIGSRLERSGVVRRAPLAPLSLFESSLSARDCHGVSSPLPDVARRICMAPLPCRRRVPVFTQSSSISQILRNHGVEAVSIAGLRLSAGLQTILARDANGYRRSWSS